MKNVFFTFLISLGFMMFLPHHLNAGGGVPATIDVELEINALDLSENPKYATAGYYLFKSISGQGSPNYLGYGYSWSWEQTIPNPESQEQTYDPLVAWESWSHAVDTQYSGETGPIYSDFTNTVHNHYFWIPLDPPE